MTLIEFKSAAMKAYPLMDADEVATIFNHFQFRLNRGTSPFKNNKTSTKEQDMNYAQAGASIQTNQRSLEGESRDYFMFRLIDITEEKRISAERHFGIRNDIPPRTARELIKRIKDGLFVLPEEKSDKKDNWPNPYERIIWRDPSVKEDHEGFTEAREKLEEHLAHARDKIMASVDPKDWHKAVEAFEKVSVH